LSLILVRFADTARATFYAETGGRKVERDELLADHFAGWIDWARRRQLHFLNVVEDGLAGKYQ
jgi:L-rhamnose isomerase